MSKKQKKVETSVFEQAMTTILDRLQSTEKFVLDQAPDVCKQLVEEAKVTNIMDGILCTALFLISLAGTLLTIHPAIVTESMGYGFAAMILGLVTILTFIGAYSSFQTLLCMKVAPKVFLIRKFKELMTSEDEDEE